MFKFCKRNIYFNYVDIHKMSRITVMIMTEKKSYDKMYEYVTNTHCKLVLPVTDIT